MILIALGSNLSGPWGTPRQTLQRALEEMKHHNITVEKVSTLIETSPFGVINQPNFVNAVTIVDTALPPEALMQALHMIEKRAGRKRLKRWGPRTLDLDLLDYHGLLRKPRRTSIKPLILPHPGILQRSFVLAPVAEIASQWKHPVTRQSAALTLRQLNRLNAN
jgi:2-amino-4-hydroxy-6-hydroxymethyldihydropteridine diphosphokinase